MTLRDITIGEFAEFSSACNMIAQKVSGRYMIKSVLIYQSGALCAFATARSSKYH